MYSWGNVIIYVKAPAQSDYFHDFPQQHTMRLTEQPLEAVFSS